MLPYAKNIALDFFFILVNWRKVCSVEIPTSKSTRLHVFEQFSKQKADLQGERKIPTQPSIFDLQPLQNLKLFA